MPDGAHDHANAALWQALSDLDERVLKLEAPSIPPQPPGQVPSGPITLSVTNKVIENVVIDTNPGGTVTIGGQTTANPTSSIYGKGLSGVTIRNVTVRGRQWGLLLVDCDNVIIENVTVLDVNYCGIGIFGGKVGTITGTKIANVGMLRDVNGLPSIGDKGNAYGIKFEVASQAGGSAGVPTDWLVTGGSVWDSPLWMGINAHQATRLKVQGVVIRRCPRAVFMAGTIVDTIVDGNDIREPVTKAGGTTDIQSVLYSGWNGGSIVNNKIGTGYPMPSPYGTQVKAPLVSGNVKV